MLQLFLLVASGCAYAVSRLLWSVNSQVQLCIELEGPPPAIEMVAACIPVFTWQHNHHRPKACSLGEMLELSLHFVFLLKQHTQD